MHGAGQLESTEKTRLARHSIGDVLGKWRVFGRGSRQMAKTSPFSSPGGREGFRSLVVFSESSELIEHEQQEKFF
jgi:hypothetical protein